MSETVALRRPPLAGVSAISAPAVALEPLPPMARFILRARPAAMEAAVPALGFRLPVVSCRSASSGARAALWLGPDEWLLLAPEPDGAEWRDALEAAMGDQPHSLVDVSHRQSSLILSGAEAIAVLNAGCPLDFDMATFPVGMCTRTVLGKSEVVIWRTEAERFHLEAWRSFLPYLWAFLVEASREFTG